MRAMSERDEVFAATAENYSKAIEILRGAMDIGRSAAKRAADAETEMELREAIIVGAGVEGSNAEIRAANLTVRLEADDTYTRLRSEYREAKEEASGAADDCEIARRTMRVLQRIMDYEIALARFEGDE